MWPWFGALIIALLVGVNMGMEVGKRTVNRDIVCDNLHERWMLGLDKHDRETAWRSMGICRGADREKAKTFHDYLTGASK